MIKQTLGTLEPVDVRNIWEDEAQDFTPWLAEPENLKRLGEAVDMDLELEGTEVAVGPYSADLVAVDPNGTRVIVENQLEKTDHDHLGKLITYASGLEANVMIWIARKFTDEHRSAIDFLNEHSALEMRLYAIEVKVVRIGDSVPAPLFEVVASPNEYSEAAGPNKVSEATSRYLDFWRGFVDYANAHGTFLKLRKPLARRRFGVTIGRQHFWLGLSVATNQQRVGCGLGMEGPTAKTAFQLLREQRAEIEAALGPLDWIEKEDKQRRRIMLYRPQPDPFDEKCWPELFEWLKAKAELFYKTFESRVKALPIDENEPEQAMAAEAN